MVWPCSNQVQAVGEATFIGDERLVSVGYIGDVGQQAGVVGAEGLTGLLDLAGSLSSKSASMWLICLLLPWLDR